MFALQSSTIKMTDYTLALATLVIKTQQCFHLTGFHEARRFHQKLHMNFNFQLAIIQAPFCQQPKADQVEYFWLVTLTMWLPLQL